jgi:hypothetical protein
MNTDIEKLSRKMFGAAIDEVYNKHKIVVGRAQPTAPSSATPSSATSRKEEVEVARQAPLKSELKKESHSATQVFQRRTKINV